MRIKSTKELDTTLRFLLDSHFLGEIGTDENLAYVRSWTSTIGVVVATDIVRVEEDGVLALREDSEGHASWGPLQGRPAETVAALLSLEAPTTGFDRMPGGWWWGTSTTQSGGDSTVSHGSDRLHASLPTGPMPATTTALCEATMTCHGYNRPRSRDVPLCPECAVAIVGTVIATSRVPDTDEQDHTDTPPSAQ